MYFVAFSLGMYCLYALWVFLDDTGNRHGGAKLRVYAEGMGARAEASSALSWYTLRDLLLEL